MPKSIYVQFLSEQPNSNPHYLIRLVKLLNHFISIEPPKKTRGYEDHHIVPKAKSWKPEWDKIPENHLKVTVKAHYIIHHLMWKAFPKDYAMRYAFWKICNRLKTKITAKVYDILQIEISKIRSESNLKRVFEGSHPFLGSKLQNDRVTNKTHPWSGSEHNNKRVTNKTHPWLGSENNQKQLESGAHPSQIKKTCSYCGIVCSSANYKRWHGSKCKIILH